MAIDNRLASQANLAGVDRKGIAFQAPRRRSRKFIAVVRALPGADRHRIRPADTGRRVRTPQVIDDIIRLPQQPCESRQITIAGLGRNGSVLPVTSQMRARRMIIEMGIIYQSAGLLLTLARSACSRAS